MEEISENVGSDEQEDWLLLLKYLRDSIRYGVPIRHLPFRLAITPKQIFRRDLLEIIGYVKESLKNKGKPLSSYKETFEMVKEFQFLDFMS